MAYPNCSETRAVTILGGSAVCDGDLTLNWDAARPRTPCGGVGLGWEEQESRQSGHWGSRQRERQLGSRGDCAGPALR